MIELVDEQLLDARALRTVFGAFATGVTVITTESEGELHGMTANSFTSVSLDPPLVLVCFDHRSRTAQAVGVRGEFVVNILAQHQAGVSHRFARPAEDHFTETRLRLDDHGLPVLLGGLGHLACQIHAVHDGGDHQIVIGRVRRASMAPGDPLAFYRGAYCRIADEASTVEPFWYA